MRRFGAFVAGFGSGMAIAYLADPDRGRSRRARLGDQSKARLRDAARTTKSKLEYRKGVARGVVHDLFGNLRGDRDYDDETLLQKVRSEALGYWDQPGSIEIDITDGTVRLTGEVVGEPARDRLLHLIREVDGVGLIDDRIQVVPTG